MHDGLLKLLKQAGSPFIAFNLCLLQKTVMKVLLTDHVFPNTIEAFFNEIKVNTSKWLEWSSYNPNTINVSTHLE